MLLECKNPNNPNQQHEKLSSVLFFLIPQRSHHIMSLLHLRLLTHPLKTNKRHLPARRSFFTHCCLPSTTTHSHCNSLLCLSMGSLCCFIVVWCTLKERHRSQNCDNDGATTTLLVVRWSMKLCFTVVGQARWGYRYWHVTVHTHADFIALPH